MRVVVPAAIFAGLLQTSSACAGFLKPVDTLETSSREELSPSLAIPYEGGFTLANGEFSVCGAEKRRPSACWRIRLAQDKAEPVGISAEAIVESGTGRGSVLAYVDVAYEGGGNLWGQKVFFDPVPGGGWQKRELRIMPERPAGSVSVYLMVSGDATAKAKFRPPVLERYRVDGIATHFDGLGIVAPSGFPADSTVLLRDVAAKTGFVPVSPGMTAMGVRICGTCRESGDAKFRTLEISLDGATADRALTLAWVVPLSGGEISYLPSPRACPVPAGCEEHRNVKSGNCGTGGCSRWPFVAASDGKRGRALGFNPELPAYGRLALNGAMRNLHAAFDMALTAEKPFAKIGIVEFGFDAADGFRGALEAYQRLFPELNAVRVEKQGNWMPFRKISEVDGWRDFGFAFKEGGNEPEWDDAHGILTFHYTEPTTWWMPIRGRDGALPTMAECIARAEALASGREAGRSGYAAAWKACAVKDVDGNPCGRIRNTPWCNGIVWNMNGSPGQGAAGEFAAKFDDKSWNVRYGRPFPQGMDGEYIDSAELYVTADRDFNRENFKGMRTPLTFDAMTLRPCIFKGLISYEYVRGVHGKCREAGRLTMANGTPGSWWWLAPYLDVMGTETDWNRKGRGWTPPGDGWLVYVRSLCGAKPYCLLQNTDYSAFTPEMCRKYMQKCLAYGMFPGFFSAQASSSSHYFSDPEMYNRDRSLFKKYLPLCKLVAEAGWRPVNRLFPVDAGTGVFAEQFGDRYVTLFNPSTNEARRVSVPLATELIGGGAVDGEICIPPESCKVLDVLPTAPSKTRHLNSSRL